jgi:uracil phosphoribosyltransferase
MAMTRSNSLYISQHPIVANKLSQLRDSKQKPKEVRELLRDLSILLGYEASRDMQLKPGETVSCDRKYFFFI